MNLLFVILNLPLAIIEMTPISSLLSFNTTLYLFYLSYDINFYVLLLSNRIFRNEFKSTKKRRI